MTDREQQLNSRKIANSIKDFYTCQGATRGDLLAMINPVLLTRAWELLKQAGAEHYSAYNLIQDWNAVTNGAAFEYASVQKYISHYAESGAGSKRQEYVAEAVTSVLASLPPSENLGSGRVNSILINLAWKLLRKNPNIAVEEFANKLKVAYLDSRRKPETLRFKTPSPHKIPNQDKIRTVVTDTVRALKAKNVSPAVNCKLSTKAAGVINAVAWRLFNNGDCTLDRVLDLVSGKSVHQIQKELSTFA